MAVQIIDGLQTTCHDKHKPLCYGGISLSADTHLIVKLPDSRIFKLLSRFIVILALTIVLIPLLRIGSIISKESASPAADAIKPEFGSTDPVNLEFLPLIFRDLNKQGILKMGNKGLMLSNDDEEAIHCSLFLRRSDMEFVSLTDLERQSSIPNESFDSAFTRNFRAASEFIDRTLKVGGIVAVQLNGRSFLSFDKPSNYRIVYYSKSQSNILVMKKIEYSKTISSTQRRLLGYTLEAKKAALKKLEDVLLEPPRAASRRSKTYLKRTKYLPDLLGDTLESYPRRVFIDVGVPEKEGGSGPSWFAKNYPTRNLKFEMYKIETLTKESSRKDVPQLAEIGMSDWLRKNVKGEEFVVMKAEAEVVEDMVKSKSIRLVDELFLECKPQGDDGRKNMSKRAYWECLALYGKLRDEGVAVHQWWG
ncbi:PREDICTED: uncharacterized protein LOC18591793 [Theobroma cacao]|uniref:Uncharacterized protein LOC18591793 n=1 Tax=Theobroma cacao TaxID=3641 RepID=A0AB32WNS5_THECC|nr:PREDICTED: uncharacterized protein LOC18591793 [Theobroma cacao]